MNIEKGMWVTINTGSLKGMQGKITRVDPKRAQVLVEIDQGLILNTFKTHRMDWNHVDIDPPEENVFNPVVNRLKKIWSEEHKPFMPLVKEYRALTDAGLKDAVEYCKDLMHKWAKEGENY